MAQVYDRPPLEYDQLNRGLLAVSLARMPGLDYFRPPESCVCSSVQNMW